MFLGANGTDAFVVVLRMYVCAYQCFWTPAGYTCGFDLQRTCWYLFGVGLVVLGEGRAVLALHNFR